MSTHKDESKLECMDNETFVFKLFKMIPSSRIRYCGNFFRCMRIERLLKSPLYNRSWIDSSSDSRPDFHNDKHHIMLEIMRIDDCVNTLNNKHVANSFERMHKCMAKNYGANYKEIFKNSTLIFNANTKNNDHYNFEGYFKNFERVLSSHSEKVVDYRNNYPKCKTCVFLVCDESNAYYQENPKMTNDPNAKYLIHNCFNDKRFIEVIKRCKSDYVVWFAFNKTVFDLNGNEIKMAIACIYDVNNIRTCGFEYNYHEMIKVK